MDVSIIIPTYNRLWCLPRAMESCRNTKCQTEIIVVDDGSTDGTWDWLSKQSGITILQQNNRGKCYAVNAAFDIAKGKYVRFLDSDDLLDRDAIDQQFAIAAQTDSDIVVSGYKLIDDQENILRQQPWINCDDFIAQQLGECDGSHYSAFLFKKHFLKDIPHRPDYAFRDDRMFILECALKQPAIAIHTGTALLHRTHSNSRLQINNGLQQSVQNFQHLNIYKNILARLKQQNALTSRRINASQTKLWPLAHWIAKTHLNEAVQAVNWIYELNPSFKIPDKGVTGFLYINLGFKSTEILLRIRRFFKYGWN